MNNLNGCVKLYECPKCHKGIVIETLESDNRECFCNCFDYHTTYPMSLKFIAPTGCLIIWKEDK